MRKASNIWERMKEQTVQGLGDAPFQTVIEITGANRVLIENHRGVITYGREKIIVKVKFGSVAVCGCNLDMTCVSKDQVVIFGQIQCISLHRKGQESP